MSRYLNNRVFCVLAGGLLIGAAARPGTGTNAQRTFATPEEAVQATVDAAARDDREALLLIFGPGGKDIVESGNAAEDKDLRAEFARSAREKLQFDKDPLRPDKVSFTVGDREWPFPVPVVLRNGKWQLDSASGRLEILARRIGRNELNAMEVCRGYAEAQFEYASEARDGDHVLKYARKVASTPGKHDGLYWEGAPESLVAQVFATAVPTASTALAGGKAEPYHGYYFRILTAQGPDAAGGQSDYVVNGRMVGGFALIAWPAEYGVSGIQTLMISHEGVVYERDLGPATALQARQTTRFNPGKLWRPVVLE